MPFTPFTILGMWFRGLLAVAILAGGGYLLYRFYEDSHVVEPIRVAVTADSEGLLDARPADDDDRPPVSTPVAAAGRRVFKFEPGWNRPTLELAAGLALLVSGTLGGLIGRGLSMLTMKAGPPRREPDSRHAVPSRAADAPDQTTRTSPNVEADEDPSALRIGEVHTIRRPDGTVLRVECYGPPDAPPLVLTHGWGTNSTEWFYQKRILADRFRLIVWDEPGLGLSKKPDDNDYRMEKLAGDLEAVLGLAGDRAAVLVGHSIGGMIILTFCKEYPEALGTRVVGLALAHTTYTNPVRTSPMAELYTALEKPVLIPLMHLTIALWPLVWVLNWLSYFNGSAHRSSRKSAFGGTETWAQLDFATRFMPHGRPDVLARGMLGMIAYDATGVLSQIPVPTLVVVGDQDTTTPPEAGAFMADHIPHAELFTLAPAKHMGLLEHHGRFNQRLADFARKCQAETVRDRPH